MDALTMLLLMSPGFLAITWTGWVFLFSYSYSERGQRKNNRATEQGPPPCGYPNDTCKTPEVHSKENK